MRKFTILAFALTLIFTLAGCSSYGTAPPPADTAPPPAAEPDYSDDKYDDEYDDRYDAERERDVEESHQHDLHDRIHAALERAPDIDEDRLTVRVKGSTVYLGGEVDTRDQKETAHNIVHAVDGVKTVHYDDIKVRRGR